MKDFCKRLYLWCIKLLQTLVSFVSVIIFSDFCIAKKIKKIFKLKKTNNCVILGNGPSLKDVLQYNLEKIKNIDAVAVNLFCENNAFLQIKPKYYVLTDPDFFNLPPKDSRIASVQERLLEGMEKVDWNMILFLPASNRKSLNVKRICNPKILIYFYNYTPVNGFYCTRKMLYKLNLGMPLAMNVLCASVFLMINSGYKEIYLLGADHNWISNFTVNDENELISVDKHFYGAKEIKVNNTIAEEMLYQHQCFHSHEELRNYADYCGAKVYNSTKGSFIDCYERKYLFC